MSATIDANLVAIGVEVTAIEKDRDDARAAVAELGKVNREQGDQIAALQAENAALKVENAALKAIIDGEVDPPDPEPDTRTMRVGAVIGPQCHTVPAFIAAIGTPGVRRYFVQGDFAPITSHSAVNQDMGRWDRCISYKATTLNVTRLHACLASIPLDGRRTWIWCQNEPERSDKSDFTAASWVRYVDSFIEACVAWVDANGRTDIEFGWSFSYWRPKTDPTIDAWWPTCPNRHRATFGIQPYDPKPANDQTLEMQTEPGVNRWRVASGVGDEALWAMSEVNTKRTGADGADWWDTGLAWAAGYGCSFAAVYDDVVGKDGPWCVVDRTVQQALGAMMPEITVNI